MLHQHLNLLAFEAQYLRKLSPNDVSVNVSMHTTKDGVYAGGDAVTGAATVILAMGAGKAAAKSIDEYIRNKA